MSCLALALVCVLGGCFSRPAVVVDDLLLPIDPEPSWLPRDGDLAAAALARAALASGPMAPDAAGPGEGHDPVELALERLRETERLNQSDDSEFEKLIPLALDVHGATLDDPIAYREAARSIRKRRGLDPRLANRLDRTIADDPVDLARRRSFDDWHRLWARTFNTVSEPLGSSVITGFAIAPFQLANSVIHYFAEFSNAEPLSRTSRQALVLRKDFLAAHPETEWTEALEKKVERDQLLFEKTLALRRVRVAERFAEAGRPDMAVFHARAAQQALSPHPGNHPMLERRAERLRAKQAALASRASQARIRSLDASRTAPELEAIETDWAAHLLAGPIDFDRLESTARAYEAAGGTRESAEFVRSIAQYEGGFEAEARSRLGRVAARPDTQSRMTRHARSILQDEWQNPYSAFDRLRSKAKRDELAYRLAGEWVRRPRYPNIPTPLAYLIDSPTIALTIVMAPIRAFLSPWQDGPDFDRAAALAGYRYLVRYPDGAEQREVLAWLYDYEVRRDRPARALRLADLMPDFDARERLELVEETADKRLEQVTSLDRRDVRASILKGVAREFPDSEGGQEAGLAAREEALDASAQHIRLTRGFLIENPDVAGREGLGLNPRLLNGDPGDGELHPEGVVLRGGRVLEIRVLAEGADDDEDVPPESILRKVGKDRLARLSATLDAAVHRNSLADLEARQAPDANRDVYLERAGLQLTDQPDARPTAESNFVYQSLRERYGLVRGRESVLPFDLVFRGSLGDFTLGAFPRWRPPKTTPDAFLYK